jgi:hypothetical protein
MPLPKRPASPTIIRAGGTSGTVIADTAAEERVQAVHFRAGQNFGDAQDQTSSVFVFPIRQDTFWIASIMAHSRPQGPFPILWSFRAASALTKKKAGLQRRKAQPNRRSCRYRELKEQLHGQLHVAGSPRADARCAKPDVVGPTYLP